MAPEVLSSDLRYDAIKSDIYSLGIVLFVMLFKILPFSAKSGSNSERINVLLELKTHLNLEFPDIIEVSEKAKKLIMNMICIDSNERLSIEQILDSEWLRNQ